MVVCLKARCFAELSCTRAVFDGLCVCESAASPDATQPVEALLDVAAYPDQAISAISFNFWHHLMRRLMLPEHSAHVRRDVDFITSHSQDPAANTRSAVSAPHPVCTFSFSYGLCGHSLLLWSMWTVRMESLTRVYIVQLYCCIDILQVSSFLPKTICLLGRSIQSNMTVDPGHACFPSGIMTVGSC